jgi:hypothetical protein
MRAADGSLQTCSSRHRGLGFLPLAAAVAALSFLPLAARAQNAAPTAAGTGAIAQSQAEPTTVPEPTLRSGVLPARLSDVEGAVHITAAQAPAASIPDQTPSPASAQTPPPPPPDQVPSQAAINMPVPAGTAVQTGDDGRAELQFDDGSIARIAPSSDASVGSLSTGGEQLDAQSGLTYYETPAQPSGTLAIRIGDYTVKPGADSLVRVDRDKVPSTIAVLRGTAELDAGDGSVPLQDGQTVTLDGAQPTGYTVSSEIASLSWDAWDADRDAQMSQMASGQTNARDGSDNADAGAWNDLDYYGTWYDVPGVGEAWAPDGVSADFDPYGAGAWGYYTGIGYTWVSAYPWGWLPYHCGIWSYYDSFGWLWQPGGCGTYGGGGWFPYTAVFNPPHNYHLPLHRPLRPFDRRLRTHLGGVPLPPLQAYQQVHRGPQFTFRALGGARPDPRPLPVQKKTDAGVPVYAETLPILPVIPSYRDDYRYGPVDGGGDTGGGYGVVPAAPGGSAAIRDQHVRSVYIPRTGVTPRSGVVSPLPERGGRGDFNREPVPRAYEPSHVEPAPRYEAPRPAPAPPYSPPPPRYEAPPPHYAAPAPQSHSSSPPVAHGH